MWSYVKKNIDQLMKWANIVFLFLFSVHLFGFPDKYIILWSAFAIAIFWLSNKKLCLDKTFWIFALAIGFNGLGTYYYLAPELSYGLSDIVKMVVPTIMVYPFMKQVVFKKNEKDIEIIVMAIVLGTFVYSLLNHYSFLQHGFETTERIWSEFWTLYPMNATHHSFWGCFISGVAGYGIYSLTRKKWLKGTVLLIFVVIENYIHIVVDNRLVLCATAVVLMLSAVMYLGVNIKDQKKTKVAILTVVCMISFVAIVFSTDMLGIRSSAYIQRFLTRDGGILKNVRFQMIYEAIMKLPSHWKGGAEMWTAGYYHVHNYWLQVANVSGIIPFAFWMIVNVSTVVDAIKIMKSKAVSNDMKFLLIPLWISIVCYLMMEPGGTESNRYIIFYVMLIALMKQVAQQCTEKKEVKITDV